MRTFCPAIFPVSFNPSSNAARALRNTSGEPETANPTIGIAGCALAIAGHAAAPAIAPRNSRRLMHAPSVERHGTGPDKRQKGVKDEKRLMSANGMVRPCSCPPPALEAGKGRQRQGACHVPDTQRCNRRGWYRYRQELIPR